MLLVQRAGHPGASCTLERAANSWYIRHLTRYIQDFLQYCPEYQIYQTRHHLLYSSLQPVELLPVLFYTITINFILVLLYSPEKYNYTISVIDKFSKYIILVLGRHTWTALQQAYTLLEYLQLANQGLPKVIISDCNQKFLSAFQKILFDILGIQLFYSTIYYPQTDS